MTNRGGEVEVKIKKNIAGQVPVNRTQQKSIITTIDNHIKIKQNQQQVQNTECIGHTRQRSGGRRYVPVPNQTLFLTYF